MNTDVKLMDIKELSRWLNIKESKIRSLVFQKQIPVVHLPKTRLLRFDTKEIEIWLEKSKSSFQENR